MRKSQQEPRWSGDIAPSLEALCCRLSKEAERMFDRDGELPGMLFLVEAPGRGQTRICVPVSSDEHKKRVFETLRRDFARWGVTRYAFAVESWASETKKGLRPSEDPERREIVCIGATDGRSDIAGMRDIHRPQYGKPFLGKLELGPETRDPETRGPLLALLHPRLCSELPPELPDETVFVTDVPSSSFQAMGRRDPTTGELCLYAIIHGAQRDDAPPGVEIVSGREAEDFIRQIQLTDPTLYLH